MFKGYPLPSMSAVVSLAVCLFSTLFLPLVIHKPTQATTLNPITLAGTMTAVDSVTLTLGAEVNGVAGPAAVNCSDPIYVAARSVLDEQRRAWLNTATTLVPGASAVQSLLPGPSGLPVNAPLVLTQPDGFQITVTPVELAPKWGFQSGANTTGIPAFDGVQMNGGPSGCTMQDNAPRPSSAMGGDYYFNQLNNGRGLNGILFSFHTPIQAFGAFFGDVETSLRGTTAFVRLLDNAGQLIADRPLTSTLGLTGGIAAENAICDQHTTPDAQVAAQGLAPGCGNGSTRWLGFVSATPVAQALVVVGDNDPLPGGRGLSEKLSVMGPTVVRTLPPADVAIAKSAPPQVAVGTPFYYTLVVSNSGDHLAAGVVMTDSAPVGITFNAVNGAGCTLTAGVVTCRLDPLPAGASKTIQVQATANSTSTVTNTAVVASSNDSEPTNNTATASVTPLAALPHNDCAVPLPQGGPLLVINEILYRQDSATTDEWVELWSTTEIPGGTLFYLSDNEAGSAEFGLAFTIPPGGIAAGVYLIIHRIPGIDDLESADGVLQFYNAGGGSVKLNDSGDNITLYLGDSTAGPVLDYVAYGSGSAIDAGSDWSEPNAPAGATNGQSIAAVVNGANTNRGPQWTLAGANGTRSPATPGANNNSRAICNVAIAKTGPATTAVGAPFDYALTLHNTTAITLTGVVVTDTEPAGLVFNGVTGAGCNLADHGFTCAVGSLLPNASTVITVNATANTAGTMTNTAYTTAVSDTIPSDNQASHAITFQALGAIGDFVYLDANHNGVQDVDEQRSIDNVPVTLHYPNGTVTTTVSVDGFYLFPYLPPATYTVTVGSAPGYERTSVATYTITLASGQIDAQADFGFAYAPTALHVTKAGPTTAILGDTLRYTLTVWNDSPTIPAIDVVLTDTLPSGLTNVQLTDNRCGVIDATVLCNLGRLAPQTTWMIGVTATAATLGSWPNVVAIAAANDPTTLAHTAVLTTLILAPTPLPTATHTPTMTPTSTPVPPTATHTVTPLPTLTATETLPPTPTATHTNTLTPTPTATATSTLTPTLLPTATVTVTPTPTNTSTATATTIPPLVPTSPTVAPTPRPMADLVLVKSAPFTFVEPGGLITYTLVYSNIGSVAAVHVMITETVPAYTTFLPTHSTSGWICPDGTHAGNTCHVMIPQIAPQQRGVLHYVVQVDTIFAGVEPTENAAFIGTDRLNYVHR